MDHLAVEGVYTGSITVFAAIVLNQLDYNQVIRCSSFCSADGDHHYSA